MAGFFSGLFRIFRKPSADDLWKVLPPDKFRRIEKLVGYKIKDKDYFLQALLHRSYLEQNSEFGISNERLEFLGDAVLSIVVAEYLFKNFPEEDEGFLTKVRAKFVNKISISDAAETIGLGEFLLVGKNLPPGFTQNSKTILADAFEALIGAVYLDNGLEAAKVFLYKVLIEPYSKAGVHLIDENFKSQLLEYAQAKRLENPIYTVIKEEGPHHSKIFTVKVTVGDEEYGTGSGKSKKNAEQNAAEDALKRIEKSRS